MKKPNFFIIGAPKCGTTSLAIWLSSNPQVFMPAAKELHHFNTDDNHIITPNRVIYEQFFIGATQRHKAVGEASVWYLHSNVAVSNIEVYSPNSKYIVCLRNPVDMAYSLHEQHIFNGNEHILSFENAWRMNEKRLKGDAVIRCRGE